MVHTSAQVHIEQKLADIEAGKVLSDKRLRTLLVVMILKYLEGEVTLNFVLQSGASIYQHLSTKLAPDLLEATSSMTHLVEQIKDKKPHSFVEHQRIEDQLVTILNSLQKPPVPRAVA